MMTSKIYIYILKKHSAIYNYSICVDTVSLFTLFIYRYNELFLSRTYPYLEHKARTLGHLSSP